MLKLFTSKIFKIILFVSTIAIIAFISNPYSYGHSNHGQELPPVLALIFGDLYLNDFAVQSYLEINPRYFWQLLLVSLNNLFGLQIDESLMLINMFSTLSFVSAIFCISSLLSKDATQSTDNKYKLFYIAAYVSALALLPLLSWGTKIFIIEAIPSTLAMGISVWTLYFALRNDWFTAFIFAGLSILIHFLVGLFAGLVILPFFALYAFKNFKLVKFFFCVVIWLIPAFYIYLNMLALETESIYQYDLFEVFGLYRVPHHWVPSTGSIFRWLSDLMLLLGGLYSFKRLYDIGFNKNILLLFLSIILVSLSGLFLNYFFVEFYRSEFIGKLQFQRILPFGHLAIFFLISLYATNVPDLNFTNRLIRFSVISFPLITVIIVNYRVLQEPILALLTILSIFLLALFFYRRFEQKKIFGEFVIFSCFLTLFIGLYFKQQPFQVIDKDLPPKISSNYSFFDNENRHSNIAKWLKENTAKNTVILALPLRSLSLIPLQAHRAFYFSAKNVPYTKNGIFEWAYRHEKLINSKIKPFMSENEVIDAWTLNKTANIQNLALSNNICFLIDIDSAHDDYLGKVIMKEKINSYIYTLWRLDNCP